MADRRKGLWTNRELLAAIDPVLADTERVLKAQNEIISRQASSLGQLQTRAAASGDTDDRDAHKPDAEKIRNMCELAVEVGVGRRGSVDQAVRKMQENPDAIVNFAIGALDILSKRQASVPTVAETVPKGQHEDTGKGKTRKGRAALAEGAEAHSRVKRGL